MASSTVDPQRTGTQSIERAFRMVQGLIREGVVERDLRTHKLFLGRLVLELGLAARRMPDAAA